MRSTIGATFGLALILSIFSVWRADASTLAATLDRFGFEGTFASHCDQPASPGNIHRSISVSARGDAEFIERFGDTYDPNVYEVQSARLKGRDTLVLGVQLNQTAQELTIRKSGNRMRTMQNRASDGTLRVKDGRVVATGQSTSWLTHCQGAE
ncbi:MAG: hypothetical protein JO254_15055 [Pseudolabrys sp.]|nr:hypothetical protein [Pseudolabrys sp.]